MASRHFLPKIVSSVYSFVLSNGLVKKFTLLVVCTICFSPLSHLKSQSHNKYQLSASWSPKLYFYSISKDIVLKDVSFSGISLIAEFMINPKLGIYSGFQYDNKSNAEYFLNVNPSSESDYSIKLVKLRSIPLGLKYYLTNNERGVIFYAKAGFDYSLLEYMKRDDPMVTQTFIDYELISDNEEEGENNLLMINIVTGMAFRVMKNIKPFIEASFSRSIIGYNAGVSTLGLNCGINLSF